MEGEMGVCLCVNVVCEYAEKCVTKGEEREKKRIGQGGMLASKTEEREGSQRTKKMAGAAATHAGWWIEKYD